MTDHELAAGSVASPAASSGAGSSLARAPKGTRRAAVVLITALSISLAEVGIGSEPLGLVFPVMWILLVPVYGAQTLVLAHLVLRGKRFPPLTALWSAGVLMGLYEFYITKVLWDQPWDGVVNTGLVEWPSVIVVAGFYHPFVSVIAPVMLAEQVLVREPRLLGLWPRRLRHPGAARVWTGFLIAAISAGGLYRPYGPLGIPLVIVTAVIIGGVVWWASRQPKVEHLADALPGRRGLTILWAMVLALFALFVLLAQVGDDPVRIERQLAAVALYAAFAVLLWRTLRHRMAPPVVRVPRRRRWWVVRVGVAIAVGAVALFVPGTEVFGVVVVWLLGGALALVMLGFAVRDALRRTRVSPIDGPADVPA